MLVSETRRKDAKIQQDDLITGEITMMVMMVMMANRPLLGGHRYSSQKQRVGSRVSGKRGNVSSPGGVNITDPRNIISSAFTNPVLPSSKHWITIELLSQSIKSQDYCN